LSISAAQLSISFDGVASVCAAQMTCGSPADSARAAVVEKLAAANTATAANGETKDRMTGS
jgi:bacterioferritin-associated ferredoxin